MGMGTPKWQPTPMERLKQSKAAKSFAPAPIPDSWKKGILTKKAWNVAKDGKTYFYNGAEEMVKEFGGFKFSPAYRVEEARKMFEEAMKAEQQKDLRDVPLDIVAALGVEQVRFNRMQAMHSGHGINVPHYDPQRFSERVIVFYTDGRVRWSDTEYNNTERVVHETEAESWADKWARENGL